MDLETIGSEDFIRRQIDNARSLDEAERKQTISQIPSLILESLRERNDILNQLLLVIYNLNTDSVKHELLNAGNRTTVIKELLRLYTETVQEHEAKQIEALSKMVDFVQSPELLVELAYALHKCNNERSAEMSDTIDGALSKIQDRATAILSPEALLMIHSIKATK